MKTIASTCLFLVLAGVSAVAAPPQKKPVTAYGHLSNPSPFTTPPVKIDTQRPDTTFEDWALGGVSEIEGGYMVTLFHKKNAGETQVIKPRGTIHSAKDEMKWLNPGAPGSFKVERVEYGKKSWKETTVYLVSGSLKGSVKFDDKLLVPAGGGAPQQKQQGPPGQPPAVNPPGAPPAAQPPGGRPPRQRVLPPTPNNSNQNQGRRNR